MHYPNSGTFLPNSYKNNWVITRDRYLANVLVKSKPKTITKVLKFKNVVLTTDKDDFVSNQVIDRLQGMRVNFTEIELENLENEGGKVENIDIFNLVSTFTGRTNIRRSLFHLKTFDKPVWQHVEYIEDIKVMRYHNAIDSKKFSLRKYL